MWVQKKINDLPLGTQFKIGPEGRTYTLVSIGGTRYCMGELGYDDFSPVENAFVFVEQDDIKFKDLKPGDKFKFVTDIKNGYDEVYMMTEHRYCTVKLKDIRNKVGTLKTWTISVDAPVMIIPEYKDI